MSSRPLASLAIVPTLVCALLWASSSPAQQWTDDQLVQNVPAFQEDSLPARLQQVGQLLQHEQEAFSAIVARIHGDHREYLLKIDRLLAQLSDPRWSVREAAERTLIDIGGRAQAVIQQRVESFEALEESIRCKRVLQAIHKKGTAEEERQTKILRGLVTASLYMEGEPRLLRSLRSALGHTDPLVVDGAIRALGRHGGDDEANAVFQMVDWKGGIYRQAALSALARMASPRALELCGELVLTEEGGMSRTEVCAMLVVLRQRDDSGPMLESLQQHPDPLIAEAASLTMPAAEEAQADVQLTLADRTPLPGKLTALSGDGIHVGEAIEGLDTAEIPFSECDILDFPANKVAAIVNVRLFLTQGSLVTGQLVSIDKDAVKLTSPVFGELTIPRDQVQGVAIDPELDRLVGASVDHDRVRLKSNEFLNGAIEALSGDTLTITTDAGKQEIKVADIAGLMTVRPRSIEPDSTIYSRVDLTNGDRVIGFVVGSSSSHLGLAAPLLGAAAVPMEKINRIEIGVGGGALWGWTLIADYSDNKIVEVDDQGNVERQVEDVFGAWDAEYLETGNLLITEFSVSRVQEIDRKGNAVWVYEELKNPYDADRLPNGNTLIADTFGSRVIEVTPDGQIAWKYDTEIRPFDTDRLLNGNTLIADVLKDRVIEVSPEGEIVWEVKGMNNVHDADRLPNGNTLITLRSKCSVIEVDRDGKVVWELNNLSSPSDADRLPNGHTLVAENTQVREFDRRGNVVWRKEMTWAVEVNRY